MVTRENLQEKYAGLETVDLLEITSNKQNYTELASSVALAELKRRNVLETEIKSYKSVFAYKPDEKTVEKYFIDLNIFQKLANYTLIVPFIKLKFYSDFWSNNGYALKKQQADFYMVMGIVFLIFGGISSNAYNANFLVVWVCGFVICFLFDIGYNKNRQINQIQEKIDQGKNPTETFS